LGADDAYKIKLYSPDQRTCVCTCLGPTFSGPLQKLISFRYVAMLLHS